MSVSIKQAKIEDWQDIKEFIAKAFGRIAPYKDYARWIWQFRSSPFSDRKEDFVPVWIGKKGKSVIAQIAIQPAVLQVDGEEYPDWPRY